MHKYLLLAAVAYGDFCYSDDKNVTIRVSLQNDRLNVNASAPAQWVGIGVPKNADFTEMPRGNFVVGSADGLFQQSLEMDYNWKPDKELRSVVDGSGKAERDGKMINISFSRLLSAPGLNPIDPKKPFNLLWAFGTKAANERGYLALQYHEKNRGHIRVDFKEDTCEEEEEPAPTPKPAILRKQGLKGKLGKYGKKGKEGKGKACTREARPCPDGSSVGRVPPHCEFAPCPGSNPIACTLEAKVCPDGSTVGRVGPRCEFAPCPSNGPILCTMEVKRCPDGSFVGREPPNCQFKPCPTGGPIACQLDAKRCPDGSFVGREPPNCEFKPCPTGTTMCPMDAKRCPDGSYVSRSPPSCTFPPCPGS